MAETFHHNNFFILMKSGQKYSPEEKAAYKMLKAEEKRKRKQGKQELWGQTQKPPRIQEENKKYRKREQKMAEKQKFNSMANARTTRYINPYAQQAEISTVETLGVWDKVFLAKYYPGQIDTSLINGM